MPELVKVPGVKLDRAYMRWKDVIGIEVYGRCLQLGFRGFLCAHEQLPLIFPTNDQFSYQAPFDDWYLTVQSARMIDVMCGPHWYAYLKYRKSHIKKLL